MIISCPNCGARYRLAASAVAAPTRMRCAACDHRWVADVSVTPDAAPPIAQAVLLAVSLADASPLNTPQADVPVSDHYEFRGSTLLRSLAALVIGGALAIAAIGLWVARIDPADLPVLGDQIAALAPRPLPLKVSFKAHVSQLPSGDRLLEIAGAVKNIGTATIDLPDLEARLATRSATARRWRIAAPVASLGPGASTAFASTATGFPADATIVAIRPAR